MRSSFRRAFSTASRKTFFALASPPGKAGVAVYRISGPDALTAYRAVVQPHPTSTPPTGEQSASPKPWHLHRCSVCYPGTGTIIDDGLAVFFRGPRSYTGLDTLELQLHSGRAVSAAILQALSTVPGLRPAEPGEFTRTALRNGKIDLTQAEGLRDLLDAETEAQRKLARAVASGKTRRALEELRSGIISALARIEALIDFGEGEDIEAGTWDSAVGKVHVLRTAIESFLADGRRGEILRSGIKLAIFGAPNAGKSTLFNFFAQREAALVTPIAGTTRDVLELHLDLGGLPVTLVDTAGLRSDSETDDVVEKLGIERARQAISDADLALCVISLEDPHPPPELAELIATTPNKVALLYNKADVVHVVDPNKGGGLSWAVSARTGNGMNEFFAGLVETLKERFDPQLAEEPIITHARHRYHLERALESIDMFLSLGPGEVVFAAEELRHAAMELGRVVGAVGVDDILDALFKDFCIGK